MESKFTKFGITIHPPGGESVNWKELTKQEISEKLKELNFWTPTKVARLMTEVQIFKERKKNKSGQLIVYNSESKDFGGQLELGTKNKTPHYQLWLELTSKTTKKKVLNYFSKKLTGETTSTAISVTVLTEDIENYVNYCQKEDRANLEGDYTHIEVTSLLSEMDKYLEDNPDSKKYWNHLMATKPG